MRLSRNNDRLFSQIIIALMFAVTFMTAQPKGHLLIIGGGDRTDEIMKKFISLAGNEKANIVVFPMASSIAETVGRSQSAELLKLGAQRAFYLNIDRKNADSDSILALMQGITGVFYSGGDQVKLTEALLGSKVQQRISEIYNNGGVVGGTSAGAAVMSKVMITGNELINKDSAASFYTLTKNNVETKEGFGFITEAIIDQHFVVRKRHNRLISKVLEYPSLLGVGIDESTCIIVNPDRSFEVLGESVVIVYDAQDAKKIGLNKNNYHSAQNLTMSILKSGDRFQLKQTKAVR